MQLRSGYKHKEEDFAKCKLMENLVLAERLDYRTMFAAGNIELPEEYKYEGYLCRIVKLGKLNGFPKVCKKGDIVVVTQGTGTSFGDFSIFHIRDVKAQLLVERECNPFCLDIRYE